MLTEAILTARCGRLRYPINVGDAFFRPSGILCVIKSTEIAVKLEAKYHCTANLFILFGFSCFASV